MAAHIIERSPWAEHKGRWVLRLAIGDSLIEAADLAARRRGTFRTRREAEQALADHCAGMGAPGDARAE